MPVTTHIFSHIGQMDENQDRVKVLPGHEEDECLLVVADGLGGHSGASRASQMIIDTARSLWVNHKSSDSSKGLLTSIAHESHDAMNSAARESNIDPRSTLAALMIRQHEIISIHAGDSRIMQFSSEGLAGRTIDHSIGQLNVLRGVISEEQLATHPDQKKLFSHIGGEDPPDVEIKHWRLSQGNRFVVCSDGFWEVFPPDEIVKLFEARNPQRELETRFSDKLSRLKKHDNTSAILVEVELGPRLIWYWCALCALGIAGLLGATMFRPNRTPDNGRPKTSTSSELEAAQSGVADGRTSRAVSFLLAQASSEGDTVGASVDAGGERGQSPEGEGEDTRPGSRETAGNESMPAREGGDQSVPVQIPRVEIRPNRLIRLDESLSQAVEDELRKAGMIGIDDSLDAAGTERSIRDSTLSRLSQRHKGVPVYAAEVAVTIADSRIVNIQGHTAEGIDINTVPANDYAATIELARQVTGQDIEMLDQGSLVVMRRPQGSYVLAWRGLVVIDRAAEWVILDSETGAIILRVSSNVGSTAQTPR